ncbi:hypothetical protein OH76DRAFT_1490551 [Lentinus brumalis]|uniref:Uncharacterized protein n=1 Tax=Lentinus brumalis TaxID=2498619 RepID=A0A371CIN8_9APHY|nr:hypothetical protein OH76DRAFT_1490551 [Polyporus brumalis]
MTPVSPVTPSRPRPLPISSEAQARRLREIERALEQVRVEQAESVADTRQDTSPSFVDPADEHIELPEQGRRKWYIALVGEKVGIWKHYADMAQYTSGVAGALHQRATSRSEAEHVYYTAKAEGRVRVVRP